MDNASRALLIAGGILISVLLMAALLSMKDQIGLFIGEQNQAEMTEQIKKYNAKFEAFNKNFMYGTDVISVISLAYDTNQKYLNEYNGDVNQAKDFLVSITVKITKDDLQQRTYKYKFNPQKNKMEREPEAITGTTIMNNTDKCEMKLVKGTYLYIGDDTTNNYYDALRNATSKGPQKKDDTGNSYKLVYSWVTDFKRRGFRCTDVEYNSVTGRITSMSFIEEALESYDYD